MSSHPLVASARRWPSAGAGGRPEADADEFSSQSLHKKTNVLEHGLSSQLQARLEARILYLFAHSLINFSMQVVRSYGTI